MRKCVTVEDFVLVGGVSCTEASNNIIKNNDIFEGRGVHFFRSFNNLVEGNTFTNCSTGVFVSIYCSGNEVINNIFDDNNYGMQFLAWTYGTSVTSNTFSGNNQGINVFGSDNNTFSGNDFVNNGIGLFLECNPGGTGYKPDNNKISTTTISWVMAYRLIYVTRITVLILICPVVVITGVIGRHLILNLTVS